MGFSNLQDQGGTAVVCTQRNNPAVWKLVGVVIDDQCDGNSNAVVKVSTYRQWILDVIKNDGISNPLYQSSTTCFG